MWENKIISLYILHFDFELRTLQQRRMSTIDFINSIGIVRKTMWMWHISIINMTAYQFPIMLCQPKFTIGFTISTFHRCLEIQYGSGFRGCFRMESKNVDFVYDVCVYVDYLYGFQLIQTACCIVLFWISLASRMRNVQNLLNGK